jgi:hypothetical protein
MTVVLESIYTSNCEKKEDIERAFLNEKKALDRCDEGTLQADSTNFVDDCQSLHSQPTSETDLVVPLSCNEIPTAIQAATFLLTYSIAPGVSAQASYVCASASCISETVPAE